MARYKSNISKVIGKLTRELAKVEKDVESATLREVATTLLASNLRRIHNQGRDVSGSGIIGGRYSTKPTLVGPNSFATKAASNKVFGSPKARAQQKWRTITTGGKKKALVLLDGGYKAVREMSGRQTGFVDLNFTGRLSKEFQMAKAGNTYVLGFATRFATEKAQGLESRNGSPIWGVSTSDEAVIRQIVSRRINKLVA